MRPPVCDLCGQDFEPAEGALVTFAPTESDAEWLRRNSVGEFVGHPPNTLWFCPTHTARADALASFHAHDALALLRSGLTARPMQRGSGRTHVEIDCTPTPHRRLYRELVDTLSPLCAAIGIETPAILDKHAHRDWTPMDGVQPPHCPYVLYHREGFQRDGVDAHVAMDEAHWNDDDIGNAGAALSISRSAGSGDDSFFLHLSGRWQTSPGGDQMIRVLWLNTPIEPRTLETIEHLLKRLES